MCNRGVTWQNTHRRPGFEPGVVLAVRSATRSVRLGAIHPPRRLCVPSPQRGRAAELLSAGRMSFFFYMVELMRFIFALLNNPSR